MVISWTLFCEWTVTFGFVYRFCRCWWDGRLPETCAWLRTAHFLFLFMVFPGFASYCVVWTFKRDLQGWTHLNSANDTGIGHVKLESWCTTRGIWRRQNRSVINRHPGPIFLSGWTTSSWRIYVWSILCVNRLLQWFRCTYLKNWGGKDFVKMIFSTRSPRWMKLSRTCSVTTFLQTQTAEDGPVEIRTDSENCLLI